MQLSFILYYLLLLCFFLKIEANNIYKIQLLHADYAKYNKNHWLLKGNIIFKHKNYKIKCNYAKYYTDIHKFIGKGNIHIIYFKNKNQIELYSQYIEYDMNQNSYQVYGDSTIYTKTSKLTGNIIIYNDNTKLFKSFGDACFSNHQFKLISDEIEYNTINLTVYYNHGGNIIFNKNIFFSEEGLYFILNEKIFFKKTYLTNQEYTLCSDKIIYNLSFQSLNFLGHTVIINNNHPKNFIYANLGIHYLNENITLLKNNSGIIHFNNYIINAKNIFFDHQKYHGYIKNNIWMELIDQKQYFIGGYGEINKKLLLFINNPLLIHILDTSKIFISSDALLYKNNQQPRDHILYAYHVNTKLSNIDIISNYMIYNKNMIEYRENTQIYFNKNNKILGNLIYLIFHPKKNIFTILIKYNTLFFNKKLNLGHLSFNYILAEIIQILFDKKKIKKVILHRGVKALTYDLYKEVDKQKIFNHVRITNSDQLILYLNNSLIKIFFIGKAKSMILYAKIFYNKKLLNFNKLLNNNNMIIIDYSLNDLIKYIKLKNHVKQYIENIKQNFLEK